MNIAQIIYLNKLKNKRYWKKYKNLKKVNYNNKLKKYKHSKRK